MNLKQVYMLATLRDEGALPQTTLCDMMRLTQNTVVTWLNELEDAGYVNRLRDPEDRRKHNVALTPKGEAALERAESELRRLEDEALSALTADERTQLRRLLAKALEARRASRIGCASAPVAACHHSSSPHARSRSIMRPRRLVVASAILFAGVVRADVWDMRAVVGNDAMNGIVSRPDDNGFTNDLSFAIHRRLGPLAFGGSILDRMITSTGPMRRCDLLEMFATVTWFLDDLLPIELRVGPTVVGDLGGLWVQSHWHRLTGTGPRDPRDTPAIYMNEFRAAGVAGLRTEAGYGRRIRAYGSLDGQVALGGTGVTFAEGVGGLRASYRLGPVELGILGEIALGRYSVDDPELAMPGAYRPGWQVDKRVGVGVGVYRYRLAFEYHTNETSSGEAFSEIVFEVR